MTISIESFRPGITFEGMNPTANSSSGNGPRAVILVRLMVGAVFFSEGIQKFLFPDATGAARFAKIGIPSPQIMAPFVGAVEIVCGLLIIFGLFTRWATVPLLINITVAILSTKIPILLGHGYWHFTLPKVASDGFWSMAHEARTDYAMLMGLLFLLAVGGGRCSLDGIRAKHRKPAVLGGAGFSPVNESQPERGAVQ
jgi:uncharacterized membrane protein YphA (DoxX/SURF4 family)